MKFGVVNKLTTVNIFVLHISHRNITHLAVIRRKTNNIKIDILKGVCVGGGGGGGGGWGGVGGCWKRAI